MILLTEKNPINKKFLFFPSAQNMSTSAESDSLPCADSKSVDKSQAEVEVASFSSPSSSDATIASIKRLSNESSKSSTFNNFTNLNQKVSQSPIFSPPCNSSLFISSLKSPQAGNSLFNSPTKSPSAFASTKSSYGWFSPAKYSQNSPTTESKKSNCPSSLGKSFIDSSSPPVRQLTEGSPIKSHNSNESPVTKSPSLFPPADNQISPWGSPWGSKNIKYQNNSSDCDMKMKSDNVCSSPTNNPCSSNKDPGSSSTEKPHYEANSGRRCNPLTYDCPESYRERVCSSLNQLLQLTRDRKEYFKCYFNPDFGIELNLLKLRMFLSKHWVDPSYASCLIGRLTILDRGVMPIISKVFSFSEDEYNERFSYVVDHPKEFNVIKMPEPEDPVEPRWCHELLLKSNHDRISILLSILSTSPFPSQLEGIKESTSAEVSEHINNEESLEETVNNENMDNCLEEEESEEEIYEEEEDENEEDETEIIKVDIGTQFETRKDNLNVLENSENAGKIHLDSIKDPPKIRAVKIDISTQLGNQDKIQFSIQNEDSLNSNEEKSKFFEEEIPPNNIKDPPKIQILVQVENSKFKGKIESLSFEESYDDVSFQKPSLELSQFVYINAFRASQRKLTDVLEGNLPEYPLSAIHHICLCNTMGPSFSEASISNRTIKNPWAILDSEEYERSQNSIQFESSEDEYSIPILTFNVYSSIDLFLSRTYLTPRATPDHLPRMSRLKNPYSSTLNLLWKEQLPSLSSKALVEDQTLCKKNITKITWKKSKRNLPAKIKKKKKKTLLLTIEVNKRLENEVNSKWKLRKRKKYKDGFEKVKNWEKVKSIKNPKVRRKVIHILGSAKSEQ
jgi:hypothetical protein